jgi:hypothetical protein
VNVSSQASWSRSWGSTQYTPNVAGENHDIGDFRGYVDLRFNYGSLDGAQSGATLRKGMQGGKAASISS